MERMCRQRLTTHGKKKKPAENHSVSFIAVAPERLMLL
jgi:hypothetical protein